LPEPPDTISFRLERVPLALEDLATSPWTGLGAASFGQRHADPTQGGAPDHIAILVVALPYEAGIIGALFFSLAVALLLLAMIRASRSGWATGLAAAYLAAIVTLLVAYQATNALVFGVNWLLAGAALALAARTHDRDARGEVSSPGSHEHV
jgi:O-antigen ligase